VKNAKSKSEREKNGKVKLSLILSSLILLITTRLVLNKPSVPNALIHD